jgi:hypothetical protein
VADARWFTYQAADKENDMVATVSDDKTVVADYFLAQIADGDARPADVVLALCRIRFPGREFVAKAGYYDLGLITLDDVFDARTGETAYDVFGAEYPVRLNDD